MLDAAIRDPASGAAITIDSGSGGLIVTGRALGYDRQYELALTTGTLAAAQAAGSAFVVLRNNPAANVTSMLHFQRIRLLWTTIAAFTVPVTAGRRLELYRGTGAAASGGTAIATAPKKVMSSISSQLDAASGGAINVATTTALTTTGIIWEAYPFDCMTLSHCGAAGAFYEKVIEYTAPNDQPYELGPGECIGVRCPVAMDAGGTWQLTMDVDYFEG
jgi:hypothetical protein